MSDPFRCLVPEIVVLAPEVVCLVTMLLTASKVLLVVLLHLVEARVVIACWSRLSHSLILLGHELMTLGL